MILTKDEYKKIMEHQTNLISSNTDEIELLKSISVLLVTQITFLKKIGSELKKINRELINLKIAIKK